MSNKEVAQRVMDTGGPAWNEKVVGYRAKFWYYGRLLAFMDFKTRIVYAAAHRGLSEQTAILAHFENQADTLGFSMEYAAPSELTEMQASYSFDS